MGLLIGVSLICNRFVVVVTRLLIVELLFSRFAIGLSRFLVGFDWCLICMFVVVNRFLLSA